MVGLNGSGKSNSLELLSELFYYLELQTIVFDKALEDFNDRYADLDFELSYEISAYKWKNALNKRNLRDISFTISEHASVIVWCTKKQNEDISIVIQEKDGTASFAFPKYFYFLMIVFEYFFNYLLFI